MPLDVWITSYLKRLFSAQVGSGQVCKNGSPEGLSGMRRNGGIPKPGRRCSSFSGIFVPRGEYGRLDNQGKMSYLFFPVRTAG